MAIALILSVFLVPLLPCKDCDATGKWDWTMPGLEEFGLNLKPCKMCHGKGAVTRFKNLTWTPSSRFNP